ncbi:pali-domain-containing protein [Annulohypoxylon maeteangense]|uniref:pali-domain-containing protein n=1 Tax=Annulohypoxylon maeteangense TaxID=1927788 RepID=UPI002008BA26|nr:pali-domain-containing protein [Annulohypoxylon maeteangense]KAI0885930.1 pali-domain-containing protein [Annulohypoxylon maeteangense]
MARTGFFHHIGTFLLFAATVLLIITDISAPVVNSISLLKIDLNGASSSSFNNNNRSPSITFGTFGYCVRDTLASGQDFCSQSEVGYDPVSVVEENVNGLSFSDAASDSAKALTRVMILHPIATGLTFIAFLLVLGAGVVGGLLASLVSLLAFLVTLVALVCDFVAFAIIRNKINDADSGNAATATWGPAIWTLLVSAICSFLAVFVVFFTCCSSRMHGRRERRVKDVPEGYGTPARRRWRWS